MSADEETSAFEVKGAFIIEKIKTKQCISKSNKLTKIHSQIMIFETYLMALSYCLEHKYNKPNGYKITTQNQFMLEGILES
jgi:hypothetical protein